MKKDVALPTPTERFRLRQSAAVLVRKEVRRIGTGGIEAVAERLMLDVVSVRRYVAGTHIPNWNTARRIHDAYGSKS